MELKSGYPYWLIKDGLPCNYPKLETDHRAEVVVMGGGISGALVAYELIKQGHQVTVLDGRTIGLGSTCASTALLQYQVDVPLTELAQKIGEPAAVMAYQQCAAAVDRLGVLAKEIGYTGFERKPTLFFASYKKDAALIEAEYQLHRQYGFKVECLSVTDIRDAFGFDAPNALYSHHSAQIDAYAFTHALLQQFIRLGGQVFDRSQVTGITHKPRSVEMVLANGCKVHGRKLVYATGYEVVQYISKKIVDLNSTYAVISEQHADTRFWKDNCLIWETKNPYLYIRTTDDGRILAGGRDEPFFNPGRRDKLVGSKARQLVNDFEKLFPDQTFEPEFRWTGTFGSTKDGLPYIGSYAPLKNALFALGFGGNGITFSAIATELIAAELAGKPHESAKLYGFNR